MIKVDRLIWDDWNREHLARHQVTPDEVEEVCQSKFQATQSYLKRFLIKGKTHASKNLHIVLSPTDRDSQPYGEGIYYVITAYEEETYENTT